MADGGERLRYIAAALLGGLLLASTAFIGGTWWERESAGTTADVEDPTNVAGGDNAPANPDGAASPAIDWPPLPPRETPLAVVFDDLTDRARRGDARAACRLATVLQRCAVAYGQRLAAQDVENSLAYRDDSPDGAIKFIDQMQHTAEELGAGCDDLVPEQFAQAYQWQKHAAMLAPELRVAFALSPALDRREFVNQLELWSDYRSLAMPWLEAAAKEGDVTAVIALARVHGDLRRNSPPVPPFRIGDDERFVVYAELMQRYGVEIPVVIGEAAEKRARLPPDAQQRATARVDELFRVDQPRLDQDQARAAMSRSLLPRADESVCRE